MFEVAWAVFGVVGVGGFVEVEVEVEVEVWIGIFAVVVGCNE